MNKLFLYYIKKNLNKERYQLVCRGRHPDRKGLYKKKGLKYSTYNNEVPLKYAKTIGVYIRDKSPVGWV
jgi:hypothetical protein|tara:strand:+ start:656 stop:862 length:207 start_codon:yes stop_codon:yes gene_type:complete